MDHIARNHGRFVTVLPRTWSEDGDFRARVVTQMPPWEEVLRRKGRRNSDPDDIWWAFTWPQPSADGYRICWYRSSSKTALITNTDDTDLTAAQLLEAYKYRPRLEQRHAELKGPMEVAPVFLKDIERIEALLLLEFLALLIRALIEREIRNAMAARDLKDLSLYPEDRACKAPTATRIFDIFASRGRHTLLAGDELVQVFAPELSPLQLQVLDLLSVPATACTG